MYILKLQLYFIQTMFIVMSISYFFIQQLIIICRTCSVHRIDSKGFDIILNQN